jgi:hypothetical protein
MNVQRAINQIDEIHSQLARTVHYRSYRATTVAASGFAAILGATFQGRFLAGRAEMAFVAYWIIIALVSLSAVGSTVLFNYCFREAAQERRRTESAVGGFLPSLAAGAAVTPPLLLAGDAVRFLPGLWAVLFSLGMFASRPYLPRIIGWVGLYYLCCGTLLLAAGLGGKALSPWAMGITFGTGQLFAAQVLYWNIERNARDRQEG